MTIEKECGKIRVTQTLCRQSKNYAKKTGELSYEKSKDSNYTNNCDNNIRCSGVWGMEDYADAGSK